MRLTSLLLFPLLLAFECHGRNFSRCELRDMLREKITLSEGTRDLTDMVLTLLVCHLDMISHLSTNTVHIQGLRAPTTTTTMPTANTTAAANQTNIGSPTLNSNATVAPPSINSTGANQTNIGNQTLNSNQTLIGANDTSGDDGQDREEEPLAEEAEEEEREEEEKAEEEEELLDELGEAPDDEEVEYLYAHHESYVDLNLDDWFKLMERLNEEENQFDEEALLLADDKLSADDDHDNGLDWSLGHHGVFQLSDSYICQSTARWSENVCNSTCDAFTDDDITDDLDCWVGSLYWLYALRTADPWCLQSDFFAQCN